MGPPPWAGPSSNLRVNPSRRSDILIVFASRTPGTLGRYPGFFFCTRPTAPVHAEHPVTTNTQPLRIRGQLAPGQFLVTVAHIGTRKKPPRAGPHHRRECTFLQMNGRGFDARENRTVGPRIPPESPQRNLNRGRPSDRLHRRHTRPRATDGREKLPAGRPPARPPGPTGRELPRPAPPGAPRAPQQA